MVYLGFQEIFASINSYETIRLLFDYTVEKDLDIRNLLVVKSAFFHNNSIQDKIQFNQPSGYAFSYQEKESAN